VEYTQPSREGGAAVLNDLQHAPLDQITADYSDVVNAVLRRVLPDGLGSDQVEVTPFNSAI
jgi:hypothetical protein